LFANYWTIAMFLARGVDVVFRRDGKRLLDWRTGQRLGQKDHVTLWHKPPKPDWMSRSEYRRMPETLSVRELAVQVTQAGFRSREVVIVTTLLDAEVHSKEDLAAVYRARWHAELDLRAIKQVMAMEVLRCKTPEMVRKEIWMHLLAYNLVRTLLAQAAHGAHVQPRELSFKGALQTLNAFAATWACPGVRRDTLYAAILKAIATHRVGNRPDRIEPRAVKRRPRKQTFLTQPRHVARKRLLAKV
ncbi:MAG TPA: transposase, partial [Phycisphaerae bacterium]|nr:transposase [Phycisphaerae bacterium]